VCHTVGSRITVAPDLSYNSGSCAARQPVDRTVKASIGSLE
jgi:hypothetical protein